MATNIDDLRNKHRYDEVNDETGEVSHEEWNRLVEAVIANQSSVRKVSVNGNTPILPDQNGEVKLLISLEESGYSAYLYTSLPSNADIVVTQRDFNVPLRFCAVRTVNSNFNNAGERGTLTFQKSTDSGRTWTDIATLDSAIASSDYSDENDYTSINIGQYLSSGSQVIRVKASFQYQDDVGQTHTKYSDNVQIGSSITYTTLSLECLQDWNTPLYASDIKITGFPINYIVNGAVSKTLKIRIQGDASEPLATDQTLSADISGTSFKMDVKDTADVSKIFTHGIRVVTAWLECDDGLGGIIRSDTLVNRFMVIDPDTAGATLDKPFLLLQNVISRVANYVQTKICDYAVFNPVIDGEGNVRQSTERVTLVFYLTSYSNTFPSGNYVEYYTSEVSVVPGVQNSLETVIEIETESTNDIQTYFRVWRKKNGNTYNFMQESMNIDALNIAIDNSESFSPTVGTSFLINPKLRNNTEDSPQTILNASNNNAVVPSIWTGFDMVNDGWVTADDGIKVLRVLAGSRLKIQYDPFAQFRNTPDSSMTLEFDLCVRNVTNETDPIVSLFETISGNPRGLIIKPMEGNFYTKSSTIASENNFRFMEDKRTLISININNAVTPSKNGDGLYDPERYNPASKIALVRVFINGNIEREMKYSVTNTDEFSTGNVANQGITIGQDGSDIDIYSIRCYERRALEAMDIVKNAIAALPTAAEKIAARRQNDIIENGRVNINKVKALGKRTLVLHGAEPYYFNPSVASVWWEIFQYNDDGTLNKDLSGTICRETGMPPKRQGSTANTYYYSNIQTKIDDGGEISIPLSKFHSSITVSDPYQVDIKDENDNTIGQKWVVGIYGGNLGKSDPVRNEAKEYDYDTETGLITVPDGWIDGNDLYRGMGFMVTEGTPLATKLVLKVNYASSMQSHLCGGTRLYSDLHTLVAGKNSLQAVVSTARVAKYTEPVYFFTQANGSNDAVFRGGGNFGAGKMDKPTWGYVKSLHPMFTMIEGSDNNYPLTDMRVPFIIDEDCSEHVVYSADDEGYFYNGLQNLDFDAGKTNDDGSPKNNIRDRIMETWNFIYMHSPMLRFYNGTYDNFLLSDEAGNTNYKYWCTEGDDAFLLKRYNFVDEKWENAGLWNINVITGTKAYDTIDLRTHEYTANVYNASSNKANYEALNNEFIAGIAQHAKKYIGWYFKVDSLQFHYAFQNHFMAGTDNCSKNTYFVIDPTAKNVTIDGVTKSCYLFEMHQDDVDTIFITDNNGRSTKPYYIDRMHPYEDSGTNNTALYEGVFNTLFNLVEVMYENTRELQSMMKRIFNAMTQLITTSDEQKGYTKSIWGCLQKYFFSIQNFYSATAYNEQARIRYEFPALLGFVSQGAGARSIAPITQSMGSQLAAETQFMIRRVVYMASYAAWGNLYDGGKTYNIGIADVSDSISMQVFPLPNESSSNNNYTFNVTPHQYIYPTGMLGQTPVDPHVRVAPGETYALNLGNTESKDTGLSVLGINYYKSIGNVGDLSVAPEVTFEVKGKRLTEFIAEPTRTYVDNQTGKTVGAFRPNQLNISANKLKVFSLKGSGIGGTTDASTLTRLQKIDLRSTYIYDIDLPASKFLTEVYLPDGLSTLVLENLLSLQTFVIEGTGSLETLKILSPISPSINTMEIVHQAYIDNAPLSSSVVVEDVNWTDCSIDLLMWLCRKGADLSGSIATLNSRYLSFTEKVELLKKYGDIDEATNELYITYRQREFNTIEIDGKSTIKNTGRYEYIPYPDVVYGNSFKSITWSLSPNSYGTIDSNTGVLTVTAVGDNILCPTATLTCIVEKIDGSTVEATREIKFYNRIPRVGDFAFLDGTFNNEWEPRKSLAGVVYMVLPSEQEGEFIVKVVNPTNLTISGGTLGKSYSSVPWGVFQESANNNGFDATTITAMQTASGEYVADIQQIPNRGSNGVISNNGTLTKTSLVDTTQEDGFKVVAPNYHFGDFNGEKYTNAIVNVCKKLISTYLNEPVPQTLAELSDALWNVVNDNEANPNKKGTWQQMYYAPALACTLYEPSATFGELDEQYTKGHWHLPSSGELVRIIHFRLQGFAATSANNDPELLVSQTPIFANANAKHAQSFVDGTANTLHLTSSEVNGSWVVQIAFGGKLDDNSSASYKYLSRPFRPVVDFRFTI